MATIKSFSDLQQSKKLAEFLPIESADMVYIWHATSDNPTFRFDDDMPPMVLKDVPISEITADTLPCWSLAALLNIIPYAIHKSDNEFYRLGIDKGYNYYDIWYSNNGITINDLDVTSDNFVDACVKMILKLHEQNLL